MTLRSFANTLARAGSCATPLAASALFLWQHKADPSCFCESFEKSKSSVDKLPRRSQAFNFVADAVETVLPSVVRVEVQAGHRGRLRGSGSGIVVSARDVLSSSADQAHEGELDSMVYVLTNAHCVLTPEEFHRKELAKSNRKVVIEMGESSRKILAKIVAFDVDKDVAIIEPLEDFEALSRSSSRLNRATVRHGEFVVAVGAPLQLENTVSIGIVSNPARTVDEQTYIQTDAAVHIGNSGGPLANLDGEVIGMNSLKIAEGITYAIPIHEALETVRRAMQHNEPSKARRPFRRNARVPIPGMSGAILVGGSTGKPMSTYADEDDHEMDEYQETL